MNARTSNRRKTQRAAGYICTALLSAFILFAGCTNEPIFAAIEKEVKLKDPTMRGTITSVVQAGTDLYATNGQIYKKTSGAGDWNKVGMDDFRCAEIATDGTHLYGLFQNEDYEIISVKRLSGGVWTAVTGASGIQKIGSGNGRIYAFTNTNGSWEAYITPNAGSSAFTTTPVATALAFPVGSAGPYFATTAGVYNSDGTAVAPGFPTSGIKGITVNGDGSILFIVDGGTAYRYNGSVWTSFPHSVGSPTGVAYLNAGGKHVLLISGAKGYGEVTLESGDPITLDNADQMTGTLTPGSSDASSINTAAKAQYSNSIELWNLTNIFAFPSPDNPYVIYAGVMDTRYDGLWAYYSATRTEWNRE